MEQYGKKLILQKQRDKIAKNSFYKNKETK